LNFNKKISRFNFYGKISRTNLKSKALFSLALERFVLTKMTPVGRRKIISLSEEKYYFYMCVV